MDYEINIQTRILTKSNSNGINCLCSEKCPNLLYDYGHYCKLFGGRFDTLHRLTDVDENDYEVFEVIRHPLCFKAEIDYIKKNIEKVA